MLVGYCVRAVLEEEPSEIEMTIEECPMERSPPILVLVCCVGAVLDEEPCKVEMAPFRRPMERSRPELVLD